MMKTAKQDAETLKTKRVDLLHVDPKNIMVEPGFNKRGEDNYGDIEGLARSIVSIGIIESLIGFKKRGEGKFIITEGHRRFEAIKLANKLHKEKKEGFLDISKINRIPFRIDKQDKKSRLIIMATTGQGKQPLTEIERASLWSDIIDMSISEGKKRGEAIAELVQHVGVSQATIYNTLRLNSIPTEIRNELENEEISGGAVINIVRENKDPKVQVKLVREAIKAAKANANDDGSDSKMATSGHVKGLKAKTPLLRMEELEQHLTKNEVSNTRTRVLNELLDGLKAKVPTSKLMEIFM